MDPKKLAAARQIAHMLASGSVTDPTQIQQLQDTYQALMTELSTERQAAAPSGADVPNYAGGGQRPEDVIPTAGRHLRNAVVSGVQNAATGVGRFADITAQNVPVVGPMLQLAKAAAPAVPVVQEAVAPGSTTQPTSEQQLQAEARGGGLGVSQPVDTSSDPNAPTLQDAQTLAPDQYGVSFDQFLKESGGSGGPSRQALRAAALRADLAGKNAEAATEEHYKSIYAQGEAAQKQAEAEGGVIQKYVDDLQKVAAKQRDTYQQYKLQAQDLMRTSAEAANAFKQEASSKSLSDSIWGEPGNKIMAALSLALGSFVGIASGRGGNPAMDVLNMRIDQDMRSRHERLVAKGQVLDNVDRLLSRNIQLFQNDEQAITATKSALLDQLGLEVKKQAVLAGGENRALAADEFVKSLKAEKARQDSGLANQVLITLQKRAAGARLNVAQKRTLWLQQNSLVLKNLKDIKDLQPADASGGDLGTPEGSRKAQRVAKIHNDLQPIDSVLHYGNLVLQVGVPDRLDMAGATKLSQTRLSSFNMMIRAVAKALEPGGRVSDQDAQAAREQIAQLNVVTGQEARTQIVMNLMGLLRKTRLDVMAEDPQAAELYDKQRSEYYRRNPDVANSESSYVPPGLTER